MTGQLSLKIDAAVHDDAEESLRELLRIQKSQNSSCEWMLISAAAIAESFTDRVIDRLVLGSPVSETPFGRKLLSESSSSFSQSWSQRNSWLKDGFGIRLSGVAIGQNLTVVVEVRNALMHGLGNLTDRQVKSPTAAIALQGQIREVLNSQVHGRKVILGSRAGTLATAVAREYVLALDRLSQGNTRSRATDINAGNSD